MRHFERDCQETCSKKVSFDLDLVDNSIHNLKWSGGGCACNLSALSALAEGMDCQKLYDLLKDGSKCGRRSTSCTLELVKLIDSMEGV